MKITLEDLYEAAEKKLITHDQYRSLKTFLNEKNLTRSSFSAIQVAYYFGAMIVIGAMGWFMNLGWESFGGGGIFTISLLYAICFITAGYYLLKKKEMRIPGGLMITMAVSMMPLIVYGLERMTGIWPADDPGKYGEFHIWINGSWLLMEIATIIAGLVAVAIVRFPFLTAPIAFAFWYLSMDLVPLFFGQNSFSYDERKTVSVIVGLAMIIISYLIDRRTKEDYSFWGYLFGMLAFWGGLSLMDSGSQLNKFLYCMLNLVLMLISVWLDRRVFIVFGALGVFGYLGYLSHEIFRDSLLFPFALSALGLLIIFLGVTYQKNEQKISAIIESMIPGFLKKFQPKYRA